MNVKNRQVCVDHLALVLILWEVSSACAQEVTMWTQQARCALTLMNVPLMEAARRVVM